MIHEEDEQEGAGARGERAVTLRYDSATLGRLDIRLSSAGATVMASEGPPADAAARRRRRARGRAGRTGARVFARRSALDAQA